MTVRKFEGLLDRVCRSLTDQARHKSFANSQMFERKVREEMASALVEIGDDTEIDFDPHPQAFPDIAIGSFGAEVKFTTADTWKSIANSVLETQRIESVKHIYVVFGKMGGLPEVRWQSYETCVRHVRTSHVPRFEIEFDGAGVKKQPLFLQMGIAYDAFRKLPMQEKMKYIRAYARKIHPDGRLWWVEDSDAGRQHTLPVQVRLYTKLDENEKRRLRAEAALLCPGIVASGRTRDKYDDVALFLLTYHGVVCHQARDLFSAGSVANPQNDDEGGVYIERALRILEQDMIDAANEMDDALFLEYWGVAVPREKRIDEWLKRADRVAADWTPSKSLFVSKR